MPKISVDLPIYTFQIDFAGNVSNIVYHQWLEIARLRLLEASGLPIEAMLEQGYTPLLGYTEINYRKALFLGDKVRVEMWATEVRGASVRVGFRFRNGKEELVADGNQMCPFVDRHTYRPRRFQPHEKEMLSRYLVAGEDGA